MVNRMKRKKEKESQGKKKSDIDLKEQLLRVNADFQNFKRRVEKEKTEWFELAQAGVLKSFLPVLDDFDRAMQSFEKIEDSKEKKAWMKGFDLLCKNFKKVFHDLGVEKIACDADFNPDYHEALMQVESKEHTSGHIVEVLNKGYTFKGKVLRPAKVSVAK